MKLETEIKLALPRTEVERISDGIERLFNCKKSAAFHQITHQFFSEDFTKQLAFPRIRNEEDGRVTLTVKVKTAEVSSHFKRFELESAIENIEDVVKMMPHFGYANKITWEKRRHNFQNISGDTNVTFSLDETPMGWFLEIEGDENSIQRAIEALSLTEVEKIGKPYLALWEEFRKQNGISETDMLFRY